MHVVAIIPARGGSKGIPGKNLREVAGKPLIAWVIEASLQAKSVARTIVSTDNEDIAATARAFGAEVDVALTIQPTCPLLSPGSIDNAVRELLEGGWDSVLSARADTHLRWRLIDGEYVPMFEERVNRQQLIPEFTETGSCFASHRRVITPNDRLGENIGLVITPEEEAVDIDSELDLRLAEVIIQNNC